LPWHWPGTAEEVWEYARSVSTPFYPLLDRVPREKWAEIDAEVVKSIGNYVDRPLVKFGVEVVVASGRKV
jgi:hypothetical protein